MTLRDLADGDGTRVILCFTSRMIIFYRHRRGAVSFARA